LEAENEQLLKKNKEQEELIKKLEQKSVNTQNFLDTTVKLLSQKSNLLKESEEKLKKSTIVESKTDSTELSNLKTDLYLTTEKFQECQNKMEKMTIFQQVVEKLSSINASEHLLSTLFRDEKLTGQEKVSKITSLLRDSAQVKSNEIKITLFEYKVDDIVLFIKDSYGNWEIFNKNQNGYFLSMENVEQLKKENWI